MKKEGWYCKRCDEFHGEYGSDESLCACTGQLVYLEWQICPQRGDGELTAQSDWTCPEGCHLKNHNED